MTDFHFWGFQKSPKKSKKWSKTTFFKNPKKCHFLPPKRSYIPSFRCTAQKVWPVEVEQRNKQTDRHTLGEFRLFLHVPTIGSDKRLRLETVQGKETGQVIREELGPPEGIYTPHTPQTPDNSRTT